MKNHILIASLLTLLFHLLLVSCSQDEDVYSCNPEINDWVKENKTYIQSLSRAEWYTLDYNVSHASYIAFTPSQKVEFWKEKFEEVKLLDWTYEELAHIQEVEDYTIDNTQYFREGNLSEDELDSIETFFAKWLRLGEKKFGWTKQTGMAIVGTGFKMIDKEGNLLLPERNNDTMSIPVMTMKTEVDCNCNKKSLISCFPLGSCEDSECIETWNGCGFLWVAPCDGRCQGT